jgi:hypothetical protein
MTDSGKFVVCDRGNERSRMQRFNKNGHFMKKISIKYIDIVAGLAITHRGEIVAVDSLSPTVFRISEAGDLLKWFDCSDYMREPSEFITLMRKVAKSPLVLDILNIQGIQKTLERLAELLAKIQKALGEYLERERSSFPSFYFVGDEDLLEIIGNSKNVPRLQRCLCLCAKVCVFIQFYSTKIIRL